MIPALECLCIVSIGIKDGVYNLKVSGNESVFFSFVWRLTYKNAQNCYGMLIKIQKSLWNLIYAQMIVFCRWLMQLHAIVRLFKQMSAYFLIMNNKKCSW